MLSGQSGLAQITINDQSVEVPKGTTYAQLKEQGYLKAKAGNLLAVDGSVYKEGEGSPAKVYANGREIASFDDAVSSGESIVDAQGEDLREPSESTEKRTPYTASLEAGDAFQFYGKTLHMALEPGMDEVYKTEIGLLSGKTTTDKLVQEMKPAVYGDYLPQFSEDKKVVAFTYDDGPDAVYTQQILDVLKKYEVKATFFMLGTSVESYPEIARTVADAGHQVASHSYSHASNHFLNKLDEQGVAYQLSTAQSVIKEATGVETRIVRPPGGNLDARGALAGVPWAEAYVGWDIGTGDFNQPGVDHILNSVRDKMHPGGIVLMHDGGGSRSQTVEASDILIKELLDQGYKFVTIDELIEMTRKEYS